MSEREAPRYERVEPITERQLEVARLIAEGRTNPEIAEALGVSLAGAKYHVSELMGRLGLERREEIAEWYRHDHGRRPLRELIGTPIGLLVGGGAVVIAAAAIILAMVALEDGTSFVAEPVPSALETIETRDGRWEVLPAPPVLLDDHFAVDLEDGRVLLGSSVVAEIGQATQSTHVWLFEVGSGRYQRSGETHNWSGQVYAVKRADGNVVVDTPSALQVLQHPDERSSGLSSTELTNELILGRMRTLFLNELRVWDTASGEFSPLEVTLDGWADEPIGLGFAAGLGVAPSGDLVMPRVTTLAGGSAAATPRLLRYDPASRDFVLIADAPVPPGSIFAGAAVTAIVGTEQVALSAETGLRIVDVDRGTVTEVLAGGTDQPGLLVAASGVWLGDSQLLLAGGYESDGWALMVEGLRTGDHVGLSPGMRMRYDELRDHEIPASARALLIDPLSGVATELAAMPLASVEHTMTVLGDGRVLIAGGVPAGGTPQQPLAMPRPLIYDPALDQYLELGDAPEVPPLSTATLLEDGSVLFLGTAFDDADRVSGVSTAVRFTPAAP